MVELQWLKPTGSHRSDTTDTATDVSNDATEPTRRYESAADSRATADPFEGGGADVNSPGTLADVELDSPAASVVGVTVLGAALRLYDLTAESLWVDEAFSLILANASIRELLLMTARDVHPPLYYILLNGWVRVAGTGVGQLRLLSVLFGVAAIPVTYVIGAHVLDEPWAGVVAAGLLAVSPLNIEHSQQVRMYSLLVLTSVLSFYFFGRLVTATGNRTRRLDGVWYVASTALLLYTHVYALFVVLAQNLYVIASWVRPDAPAAPDRRTPTRRRWFALQGVVGLLYAPWVFVLVNRVFQFQSVYDFYSSPSVSDIHWALILHAGSFYSLPVLIALAVVAVVAVDLDGVFEDGRLSPQAVSVDVRHSKTAPMLWLWWLVPILSVIIVSTYLSPFFSTRYTIGATPALYLLAGAGVLAIRRVPFGVTSVVRAAPLLVVILLVSSVLVGYYATDDIEQWDEATEYVEARSTAGDAVVLNSGTLTSRRVFRYYYDGPDIELLPFPAPDSRLVTAQNVDALGPMVEGHDRVWVVLSHSRDCDGRILRKLNREYSLVDRRTFLGVSVYRYEIEGEPIRTRIPPEWPRADVLAHCD